MSNKFSEYGLCNSDDYFIGRCSAEFVKIKSITVSILKKNTVKNYEVLFTRFNDAFGPRELESITSDEILSFLTKLTDGTKQATKRNRYSSLKAFFNFIKNSIDPNIQNPCVNWGRPR